MKNDNLASVTQLPGKEAALRAPHAARSADECPPPGADGGYDQLDRAMHAAIANLTAGLSPAALWLAAQDWFNHLAISPGKGTGLDLAQLASACAMGSIGSGSSRRAARSGFA